MKPVQLYHLLFQLHWSAASDGRGPGATARRVPGECCAPPCARGAGRHVAPRRVARGGGRQGAPRVFGARPGGAAACCQPLDADYRQVRSRSFVVGLYKQWGCAILFNPLAAPPCNGVLAWTEVDLLLQKYRWPTVIYSSILQILL